MLKKIITEKWPFLLYDKRFFLSSYSVLGLNPILIHAYILHTFTTMTYIDKEHMRTPNYVKARFIFRFIHFDRSVNGGKT